MTELNPPWALQNLATHTAQVNRMLMAALAERAEGVVEPTGLAVTQRGAGANMSVDIAAGSCLIAGDENAQQGIYGAVNDATKNVVISAADPTNPRRDLVVAKVQDTFYSGATNAWSLAVVTGTAAGSPVDPAVPNNAIVLARVAVAAAAASIVNANITDLRPFAPVGILPVNSARPPGTLYGPYTAGGAAPAAFAGLPIVEIDTGRIKVHDGTAFRYVAGGTQPQYAARMNRTAAITSATGTVVVPFDTVDYDYNSNLTTGAAAKYTAPIAGLYDVRARVGWDLNNNPQDVLVDLYVNGALKSIGGRVMGAGTAGDHWGSVITDTIVLAAADTVDIRLQNNNANAVALAVSAVGTYFAIRRI